MKKIKELNLVKDTLAFLLMFLFGTGLYAQDVTFPGPSGCGASATLATWTVPCDVTSITVDVYGGGGGGGGGGDGSNGGIACGDNEGGGGGGGGAYTSITINVIPGSSFSYSPGSGGCGGDNDGECSSGEHGGGGGTSTFSGTDALGTSIVLSAGGGQGGRRGSSDGPPGGPSTGGVASGGTINTSGTGGGAAQSSGSLIGGVGGAGAGPLGGAGGTAGQNTSTPGVTYGGGGGGGGDSNGGIGASGAVVITYVTQGSLIPTVVTIPASCTTDGMALIGLYNAATTYTFTPSGPSVVSGGGITGLVAETDYTVIASIGTCTSTPSLAFSVEEQLLVPTVSISGELEYCEGESTTITASGAQDYLWDDQAASTTANITVTQGTYIVSGTDAGCSGTATVTVTEVLFPIVDLGTDQEVCEQATSVLDAGAGAASYNWSSGDITQTAELGVGTHWAEATNGACSASDTIVITETQNPEPQIAPTSNQLICDGGTVTLDAGSGYDNYSWEPNGEQTQTISVSASGSYSAVVTDVAGCNGTTDTVEVTILNVPDAVITANGPLEICQGESVSLDAGSGYDTYLWSNSAITQGTNASVSGDYSVTGTLDGCPFASDTVTVVVNTFIPEITGSDSVVSVTGSYSTYQWFLNGDPIPGATGPDYNPLISGNYTVVVTDDDGCSGQSDVLDFSLPPSSGVGINELDEILPFVVYPNPSNGQFQIEMDMKESYSVEVMNAIGQVVYMEKSENGNRSFIKVENNGMYLVQVVIEDRVYHKRVVVQQACLRLKTLGNKLIQMLK